MKYVSGKVVRFRAVLDDDLVARVQELAGVSLNSDQKTKLRNAAGQYDLWRQSFEGGARPGEVKERLQKVAKQARALLETLRQIDPIGDGKDAAGAVAWGMLWNEITPDLDETMKQIEALVISAERSIEGLQKDTGGPDGNPALPQFIKEVHAVLTDAGASGKGCHWDDYSTEYKGWMLDVMAALLECIEGSDSKQSSLGKAIQRALK